MSLKAFSILLALTATTSAQAARQHELQAPPPPQFGFAQNPQELIRRVERIESQVRRDAYTLTPSEVRLVNQMLDPVETVLRMNGSGPGPGGPGPGPGPFPQPAVAIISGNIETLPFNFQVADSYDFFTQCIALRLPHSADEASVSVNFGPSQQLPVSNYYWRTTQDVCSLLVQAALGQGLPRHRVPYAVIVATLETNTPLVITGNNLVELNTACLQSTFSVPYSLDDYSVQVNFGAKVSKISNSYLRTKEQVCMAVLTEYQAQAGGNAPPR